MSHFYGVLSGSRGEATRCGGKGSGLRTTAASWSGAIIVSLGHNETTGEDTFLVEQTTWRGQGISEEIARGIIGQATRKENVNGNLVEVLKDAAAELIRLHVNQQGIAEEDLTDIARPDESVIAEIQDAIKKAEG